jgi:hypothetical protein
MGGDYHYLFASALAWLWYSRIFPNLPTCRVAFRFVSFRFVSFRFHVICIAIWDQLRIFSPPLIYAEHKLAARLQLFRKLFAKKSLGELWQRQAKQSQYTSIDEDL